MTARASNVSRTAHDIKPAPGGDYGTLDRTDFGSRVLYPAIQRNIRMMGQGEKGKNCGDEVLYICPHCAKEYKINSKCVQRDCPDCAPDWAMKEARIMRARVHDLGKRLHHVVISFKESIDDVDDVRRLRKRCYRVLRKAGADGGLVVFHPYRESVSGRYDKWSPHFHAIVSGRWLERADCIPDVKRGECVVKRIGRVDYALERFYYLLHHAGFADNFEVLAWWGCMARNHGQGPGELAERHGDGARRICPECGTELEPGTLTDWTSFPSEVVYRRVFA